MTDIKRYYTGLAIESDEGRWIKASDHDKAMAEKDEIIQQQAGQASVMTKRIAELEALIDTHNKECEELCNPKNCGYENYPRLQPCPNCPKDWKLEKGEI